MQYSAAISPMGQWVSLDHALSRRTFLKLIQSMGFLRPCSFQEDLPEAHPDSQALGFRLFHLEEKSLALALLEARSPFNSQQFTISTLGGEFSS